MEFVWILLLALLTMELVLLLVLLIFGPGLLPKIEGALGRGMRPFRLSVRGKASEQTENRGDREKGGSR